MAARPLLHPGWMRWVGGLLVPVGLAILVVYSLDEETEWYQWALGPLITLQGCTLLLAWRREVRAHHEQRGG